MKKLLILLGLIFVAASSSAAQFSNLPKKMPAGTEMRFGKGSGLTRSFVRLTVSGNRLLIERQTAQDRSPQSRSAEISSEDKNELYQLFVANRFDLKEIERNKKRVYDAPSQSIFISAGKMTYKVSNDATSPLAGANLKSYQNIKAAFEKLLADYENKAR